MGSGRGGGSGPARAVGAKAPAARGDLVIVRHQEAAVAHDGQVLRRVERKRAGAAEGTDLPALPRGPMGLGAVLQKPELVLRAEILDGGQRSEEHTSELQSQSNIVCRL